MELLWPPANDFVPLSADVAHVWAVPLDWPVSLGELRTILSPNERDRAERFRLEAPRRRFIVARAALRKIIARYLDMEPMEIALMESASGKPQLAQQDKTIGLQFNLAHSHELALVVIAAGCEVGVDVEQLRNVVRGEQIARRYFHESEMRDIQSRTPDERDTAFLRCWTAKEAILKATGRGLSAPLNEFQVPVAEQIAEWVQVGIPYAATTQRFWLQSLTPSVDYAAALALLGEQRNVQCYAWLK